VCAPRSAKITSEELVKTCLDRALRDLGDRSGSCGSGEALTAPDWVGRQFLTGLRPTTSDENIRQPSNGAAPTLFGELAWEATVSRDFQEENAYSAMQSAGPPVFLQRPECLRMARAGAS
jgi:hypothetical protein